MDTHQPAPSAASIQKWAAISSRAAEALVQALRVQQYDALEAIDGGQLAKGKLSRK